MLIKNYPNERTEYDILLQHTHCPTCCLTNPSLSNYTIYDCSNLPPPYHPKPPPHPPPQPHPQPQPHPIPPHHPHPPHSGPIHPPY